VRTRVRPRRRAVLETGLARVLHWLRGVNTTPSPWLLGWMVLGSFAAVVLYVVQVLKQAALLS
jgi:hypothetical protein